MKLKFIISSYSSYFFINLQYNTMMSKITILYNSRKTMMDLLINLNYDVSGYNVFSINEIDTMNQTDQLDMLVHHKTDTKKAYIKYYLPEKQKQISRLVVDEIIDDLFHVENILTKQDTLIIIMDEEPNESNINKMNFLYEHDGCFIVMHNIKRLQYNILNHQLVPKMTIMKEDEVIQLMLDKKIQHLNQLPEISRYDPHALVMCLRPNEVCKIERNSVTALNCIYYRVCV